MDSLYDTNIHVVGSYINKYAFVDTLACKLLLCENRAAIPPIRDVTRSRVGDVSRLVLPLAFPLHALSLSMECIPYGTSTKCYHNHILASLVFLTECTSLCG